MQPIDAEYANEKLTVKPGDRLHRVVALLFDTYCDDVSDARIAEIEALIQSWRWMNAAGKRLDVS